MSGVQAAVGHLWWVRTIRALVPIGLTGAMLAHLLPFFNVGNGPIKIDLGIVAFFAGLLVLKVAPTDPYVEAFMLPLISAVVGLFLLTGRGRLGTIGPLVSALVGFIALGSGYFLGPASGLAFGYYTAEGFFLIAAVAAAARLILILRFPTASQAKVRMQRDTSIDPSQELHPR